MHTELFVRRMYSH